MIFRVQVTFAAGSHAVTANSHIKSIQHVLVSARSFCLAGR